MFDLITYAHDGRGLGHLSRAIAIAIAAKRMSPRLRVAVLTGSRHFPELAGAADLDWIKLPSFATQLTSGRPSPASGPSRIPYRVLAELRAGLLLSILPRLRPRAIIVDHHPDGKESELLPAMSVLRDSKWYLGVRAEPGPDSRLWSHQARDVVKQAYSGVFWYGDSGVTSRTQFGNIRSHFESCSVSEAGYVSRAAELAASGLIPAVRRRCGAVAAIAWRSAGSDAVLRALGAVMERITALRPWRLYLSAELSRGDEARQLLRRPGVRLHAIDFSFLQNLRGARFALAYAGYNTVVDVLWSGTPAVLITRGDFDQEQVRHMKALNQSFPPNVTALSEEEAADPRRLLRAVTQVTSFRCLPAPFVNLGGAAFVAAKVLRELEP